MVPRFILHLLALARAALVVRTDTATAKFNKLQDIAHAGNLRISARLSLINLWKSACWSDQTGFLSLHC
jgi:hypothetical protein